MELKKVKCRLCKRKMFIEQPEEPIDPYVAALGYKKTGRWWHQSCLYNYLEYSYLDDHE